MKVAFAQKVEFGNFLRFNVHLGYDLTIMTCQYDNVFMPKKIIQSENNLLLLKFLDVKGAVASRKEWAQNTLDWLEQQGQVNYFGNLLSAINSIDWRFVSVNRVNSRDEFHLTLIGNRVLALLEPVWIRGKGWFGGFSAGHLIIRNEICVVVENRSLPTDPRSSVFAVGSHDETLLGPDATKDFLQTSRVASNVSMVNDPWYVQALLPLDRTVDPACILNKVAMNGIMPPEGPTTRALMTAWTTSGRLNGGKFKTDEFWGYGMNGLWDEPFLSVVLGSGMRKKCVLQDIKLNAPDIYDSVISKLLSVAKSASLTRKK